MNKREKDREEELFEARYKTFQERADKAFKEHVDKAFDEAVEKAYLKTCENMDREERAFYFLAQVLASNYH